MVVILPILLERQWRWPSTILSGEPLFYLEPLLIRLFSALFSGPPPLIRGGAANYGAGQRESAPRCPRAEYNGTLVSLFCALRGTSGAAFC